MSSVSEMVSNNIVLVVDAESTNSGSGAVKVRGARKPTLNGKYSKMMTMAYQLCQHLREQNVIVDDAGFESSLAAVQMWGSIEEQSAFYERLTVASGESGKSMRRVIALHHKPVKQSKPRAKKEATGEKKVRGKKADRPSTPVLVESETEVVAEPVAAAKKAAKPRAPKKVAGATAVVVTEAAAASEVAAPAAASVAASVDAATTVESTKPAKAKKSKATVVTNKSAAASETVESAVPVPAPVPVPVPVPVPIKDTKARGRKKQEISIVHNDEENTIAQMVAAANRTDDYVEEPGSVAESTVPVPVPL